MVFKMTVWLLALVFVAMVYNGVSAYSAMGAIDVQTKFEKIGLIAYGNPNGYIIPVRKPVPPSEDILASLE